MTWIQSFLVVLVALIWAFVVVYVVLTDIQSAPAIVGLMTPPLMFVLGAAVGVPLRKISKALRDAVDEE